jgi:TetR/AcrR family transcriptional regulator, cholesterol catabolism regulator
VARPSRYDDIVRAAAQLFGDKGYDATSLEDIAGEVGIWKGSIYHYIDTKQDLLLAVVRLPAERILAVLRETVASDLPPSEKIRAIVRNHVTVLDEVFVYASVYLQEIAGRHYSEEWAEMDREYVRLTEKVVMDGIADGSFSSELDARVTTFSLIGSLNWLVRWYQPNGPMSAMEIADRIGTLFVSGLVRRSPTTL